MAPAAQGHEVREGVGVAALIYWGEVMYFLSGPAAVLTLSARVSQDDGPELTPSTAVGEGP
tara:strand:- start:474 stop:656 length:183 start_codon:yes stop_codon:yes gene_type:complete